MGEEAVVVGPQGVSPSQLLEESLEHGNAELAAEELRMEEKKAWDTKRGQRYGAIAAVGLSLGFAGFVPGYFDHFKGQQWYYEAISRVNFAPAMAAAARFGTWWETLLSIHAVTAVAWTALALNQVATGAIGAPNSQRRLWHRRFGYVSAAIGLCVALQAIVLLVHMPFDKTAIAKGSTAAMIAYNLFCGVRYARAKNIVQHKYAMMWACLWSAAPGHTRVFAYLRLLVLGCPVSTPLGLLSCSTFLGALLVAPALVMPDVANNTLLLPNGVAVFGMFKIDIEDAFHAIISGDAWCKKS
eukprot:TRINITY_DN38142_c0_g1_i1.p1 TRINITY_DN38142_c0_g1~~TRINITY_DN38142_c0_g1_i1.p1  ORF type:complete len:311 (-),score=67.36 TRINITY_DN38142_c0_g1_i1:75-971(-)